MGPITKQVLQASVDHAYQQFLRRVADGRKKPVDDVDKIAQGRVWAGVDAQRIGLVDHLGGLKDATDAAAKLAELGSDYDVDYIETELSLRSSCSCRSARKPCTWANSRDSFRSAPTSSALLDPLLEQARVIARLKDPHGLYSYCWCREPPAL